MQVIWHCRLIAVGATAISLPERQLDFDTEIVERMRIGRIKGRNHHIIIVAEGYGSAQDVAETRFTRLPALTHPCNDPRSHPARRLSVCYGSCYGDPHGLRLQFVL